MINSHRFIAAGILRQENKILLVEQQGKNDPSTSWALPGGIVEKGELVKEALIREVKEETGYDVLTVGPLAYFMQVDHQQDEYQTLVFVFEVQEFAGTLSINDPDNFILSAAFFSLGEAIQKLDLLPWRSMKEPLIEYLKNPVKTGNIWQYRKIMDQELIRI